MAQSDTPSLTWSISPRATRRRDQQRSIKHAPTVDIALPRRPAASTLFDLQLHGPRTPSRRSRRPRCRRASRRRIPDRGYGTALRVLDGGALGSSPDLTTAEDAKEAVSLRSRRSAIARMPAAIRSFHTRRHRPSRREALGLTTRC